MLKRLVLVFAAAVFLFMPITALADSHDPKRILASEVMERLNMGEDILFLDTRTSYDWSSARTKIKDAIRVNNEVLARIAKETPKDKLIVTYCT
ncbi:MAG TPA: hypothetical protein VJ974_05225 [Geopsychrobacteraceae bacterium]|nr:hypothetical protein [Geopsychrobacteraceae bacterium]